MTLLSKNELEQQLQVLGRQLGDVENAIAELRLIRETVECWCRRRLTRVLRAGTTWLMPSLDYLEKSARRVERARNRLTWQRRLVAKTNDPTIQLVATRMVATLKDIERTMSEAHNLLVERSQPLHDGER